MASKLGVVGLNTSFLQLDNGNYNKRLGLSSRQFHAACLREGDKWVEKHHANLLMTHHPSIWLDSSSKDHLENLIHTSNYFVVHLCGHEHETRYTGVEQGSGWIRRTMQAPSLFGLETCFTDQGNQEVQRSHGYVASKIEFNNGEKEGNMIHWPRYRPGSPNRAFRLEADNVNNDLSGGIYTSPATFKLRKPFAPPPKNSSSCPDESHYDDVVKAIKEGALVAILGSEVNLYGRGGQDDDEVIDWELHSKFPPTSRELALHLIQKFGLPHKSKKFRCPLCSVNDEHELPPKECWFRDEFLDENAYIYCPRMESDTKVKSKHMIVGRSPLHSSSQYANLTSDGSNKLLEELEKIFHVDKSNESKDFEYQTNPVLDFFAHLPKSLKAKGFTLPYPLIITTNYDTALEVAFKRANQEYDLVFYMNSVKGKDQFLHRKPNGEIAPITDPNDLSLGISFEERPVILKLYGTTDHMNENEGLVITEDNFIEYLVERNIDRLLHVSLKDKINIERNHLLFLGFGLSDWNHRIILHRLWPNQQLKNCWSIQRVVSTPDQLDQKFWNSLGIEPLQISLKTYVDELTKQIDSL
ncbi:SIR2 family NAD-dependent protein deacylase [Pseudanabaena sp. PCC 6802]|uniref:SIR2 family NAD-dependent protein deacylase n=1 Tax=Pseudanabaena sp. PCC 6802 TaxID=118173 RepID=UPI000348A2B2|nr:SIR2 family protein [Pseudanabaena sp. PCC 6802]